MYVHEIIDNSIEVVNTGSLGKYIGTDDFLLKLSSSKVNDKFYVINKTTTLKGIRLKEHRPDTIEIVYVGPDLDMKDTNIVSILCLDLTNVLAAGSKLDGYDTLENMKKLQFVNKMKRRCT